MKELDEIIGRIAALQSVGSVYFDEGLFPAQRTNAMVGYQRPDTTVFFTAIMVFTLQKISHLLSPKSQLLVGSIAEKAIQNYPKFRNKDGLKTYNFWKTKPSKHFPNGYLFHHFDHFRIPDDVDDTAMIYLTTSPTEEDLLWLKEKLSQHANRSKHTIRNTYPEYRQLRAYSTWFGKNMYIEFDACVLSNLLYCVYHYQLPLNQHDYDSLTYIRSVIETDRYLTEPFRCAHQYPRTVLIIYHVARLMGAFHIPELDSIKDKIINDIYELLQYPQQPLDEILLKTSLLRLGEKGHDVRQLTFEIGDWLKAEDPKTNKFYFFIAGLLTAYENPALYHLAKSPLFHIQWKCEAHSWVLVAEYLALLQEN
ncbi:MAG: hypothetical protein R2822_02750 [Spirosomataceae bacterium]